VRGLCEAVHTALAEKAELHEMHSGQRGFDLSSAIMLAISIVLDKEFTDERMIRSPGHSFFSIGCGAAGRDPRQSRRHPTRVAEGHILRPRSSCHFPKGTKRKKREDRRRHGPQVSRRQGVAFRLR